MTHVGFDCGVVLTPSTASTVATRKANAQDKHKATGSASVDFHVDNATTKE